MVRVKYAIKQLDQAIESREFSALNESFFQDKTLIKDELDCLQKKLAGMAKQIEKYHHQNQSLTHKLKNKNKRLAKLNYQLSEQVTNRNAEIEQQFFYDRLTRLPNRNFFL